MSSILITGASKGIGRAAAVELARRGHRVIATARDPRALSGLDVDQRLRLDVTDQASVDAAVAQAGEIDVLVSNAGVIFRRGGRGQPGRRDRAPLRAEHRRRDPRYPGRPAADARAQEAGGWSSSPASAGAPCSRGTPPTRPRSGPLRPSRRRSPWNSPTSGSTSPSLEPGPVSSGALDDPLAYRLPDDPYAFLFARGRGIPAATMISSEEVAAALADLAEQPAVPLRVPIGSAAEKVLAARDAAPYDRPFVRA